MLGLPPKPPFPQFLNIILIPNSLGQVYLSREKSSSLHYLLFLLSM